MTEPIDFDDISNIFIEALAALKDEQEQFWNGLSKEDQLKAFCAVARRIFKGEIEDKGSYRYVLYDIFKFDADAYIQAQDAGYLAIHNAIIDEQYDSRLLTAFCKKYNIEDAEAKVQGIIL